MLLVSNRRTAPRSVASSCSLTRAIRCSRSRPKSTRFSQSTPCNPGDGVVATGKPLSKTPSPRHPDDVGRNFSRTVRNPGATVPPSRAREQPRVGEERSSAAGHRDFPRSDVRPAERHAIELDSGVRWERLTSHAHEDVDFLHVVYDVGGASAPAERLMRHAGREYGTVLSGRLNVQLGFEVH